MTAAHVAITRANDLFCAEEDARLDLILARRRTMSM